MHASFSFSTIRLVDHFQNVRDIIKVLAKLSVLPSMVGLVDPAAVWMLFAEPRTVAAYFARSMSPAAGRILKALAEDSIIGPDDLAALPELTEKHVCAVIHRHLELPREMDGQHKPSVFAATRCSRTSAARAQSARSTARAARRAATALRKASGSEPSTEAMPADRRRASSAKVTTRPTMSVQFNPSCPRLTGR